MLYTAIEKFKGKNKFVIFWKIMLILFENLLFAYQYKRKISYLIAFCTVRKKILQNFEHAWYSDSYCIWLPSIYVQWFPSSKSFTCGGENYRQKDNWKITRLLRGVYFRVPVIPTANFISTVKVGPNIHRQSPIFLPKTKSLL